MPLLIKATSLLLALITFVNNAKLPEFSTETSTDLTNQNYWYEQAQKTLNKNLKLSKPDHRVAKNLILFLGDGMGMSTITASRIYKGQKAGLMGEDAELTFDEFPHMSLSKTYALDKQTSDSANTATAFLCGVKANYGTLGVNGKVLYENCNSSKDNSTYLQSILEWAQEDRKSTGFVTSTRVTHATPAGLYAHTASRYWEFESPDGDHECPDIALQLIKYIPGKNIQVILGGGREAFFPNNELDVETKEKGKRTDRRYLIDEWLSDKKRISTRVRYVTNMTYLRSVRPEETDYLLGLLEYDNMPYELDRPKEEKKPAIWEMTDKAIRILKKNPNGFFLLVEGGRIDHAHHDGIAKKALEETVAMDKAIELALSLTDTEDTLIVVTADHSHTMTISGYPELGNNILGTVVSDENNVEYTVLSYANGPGYNTSRDNFGNNITLGNEYKQLATFYLDSETHAGEDVPVFAIGPMAHLFQGVHDQSYIPHAMSFAACIGPNKELCNDAVKLASHTILPFLPLYFYGLSFLKEMV